MVVVLEAFSLKGKWLVVTFVHAEQLLQANGLPVKPEASEDQKHEQLLDPLGA